MQDLLIKLTLLHYTINHSVRNEVYNLLEEFSRVMPLQNFNTITISYFMNKKYTFILPIFRQLRVSRTLVNIFHVIGNIHQKKHLSLHL